MACTGSYVETMRHPGKRPTCGVSLVMNVDKELI